MSTTRKAFAALAIATVLFAGMAVAEDASGMIDSIDRANKVATPANFRGGPNTDAIRYENYWETEPGQVLDAVDRDYGAPNAAPTVAPELQALRQTNYMESKPDEMLDVIDRNYGAPSVRQGVPGNIEALRQTDYWETEPEQVLDAIDRTY